MNFRLFGNDKAPTLLLIPGLGVSYEIFLPLIRLTEDRFRIIRMRKVPFVDSTAMHNLSMLIERSHREGMTIILSGVNQHVHKQLLKGGIEQMMNPDNICPNIHVALRRAETLLRIEN